MGIRLFIYCLFKIEVTYMSLDTNTLLGFVGRAATLLLVFAVHCRHNRRRWRVHGCGRSGAMSEVRGVVCTGAGVGGGDRICMGLYAAPSCGLLKLVGRSVACIISCRGRLSCYQMLRGCRSIRSSRRGRRRRHGLVHA